MRILITIVLISSLQIAFCQKPVDALANSVCSCIDKSNQPVDSVTVTSCFVKALSDTINSFTVQSELDELINTVQYKLMKMCPGFIFFNETINPLKGGWVHLHKPVSSKLTSSNCHKLTDHINFHYLEKDGDTTKLVLKNNMWMESFNNGKYFSKLSFKWTSGCDFTLEFIESNDSLRNNSSNRGDKYYCRIIDQLADCYLITITYNSLIYQYKLYF